MSPSDLVLARLYCLSVRGCVVAILDDRKEALALAHQVARERGECSFHSYHDAFLLLCLPGGRVLTCSPLWN